MMATISRDSIMTLEAYSRERKAFREKVIAHKRHRTAHLGAHVTLIFEDELTIRYQIQEMLRAERIFEEQGIEGEIEAYAPLIPDGRNWKATMLLEYEDVTERAHALAGLKGIEDQTWVQAGGQPKVFAIADEDLERENETKTSAVHFLRFELSDPMVVALKAGAGLTMGVDHANYAVSHEIEAAIRDSLTRDLT